MNFQEWVDSNYLSINFLSEKIFEIENVGKFLILQGLYKKEISKNETIYEDTGEIDNLCIISKEFSLLLSDKEYELANEVNFLCFNFGSKWYYSDQISQPKLQELRYLGKPNLVNEIVDFPFLGIHGGYDLCNGSRTYNDWCKKAKFLQISTLGLCEENTLAGVVSFQNSCKKNGIRSIVGESINVQFEDGNRYFLKLFCKDIKGWKQLLSINTIINVINHGFITSQELIQNQSNSLILVLNPTLKSELITQFSKTSFITVYSLDFSEWESQDRDRECLENFQNYIATHPFPPVVIQDAFYLEKQDSKVRRILGLISQSNFKNYSPSQYFKNIDDFYLEALDIVDEVEKFEELFYSGIINTIEYFDNIDFSVISGEFYLPRYEMSVVEKEKYTTNEELLYSYIEKGLEEKVVAKNLDYQTYLDRVNKEWDVIQRGGFIDYFLILCDVYRFCDEEDIWYGVGRGSAGGCLISYLCNIVSIDPIHYNLIFERFLNEGRLGHSLPDIDCDFMGSRRDEIKRYLEKKYGEDYVMSIGTYGTFKLKNSFKDLTRVKGFDSSLCNYITSFFPDPGQQQPQYYWELIQQACKFKPIYDFISKYPEPIEELPLILNQPKNSSIHAAGVVIVPKEYGTIYEQLPVKQQDGLLVSEWEGHFIDEAGFLKIDVLGIKQLDKFASISKLIKEQLNKNITFKDVILDDQQVFDLFRQGSNEDVFQFGAAGLKAYCKELQPDNIEDLIATVAVYRPGPIESGTHMKYISRKNGKELVDSDPGCEEITKNTYGLIVYQEQVMQICQHLAGFSLVEADDIRKGLGKMRREIVDKYEEEFMNRVISRGYEKSSMKLLWEKMAAFASYAFNRSHAACYAITGYYSQWFKVHYPLQFWTISLQFSDDDDKPKRISEIRTTSTIQVLPVDINRSNLIFRGDLDTQSIYWALPSVKWVGEKVVGSVLEERKNNGNFFNLEEFYHRMKSYSGVNSRAISHLIICGAFDEIENIKNYSERFRLLESFFKLIQQELKDDYKEMKSWSEHQWVLRQKELSGFGVFDFNYLLHSTPLVEKIHLYKENTFLLQEDVLYNQQSIVCIGLIEEIVERNSKNGKFGQVLLRDNSDSIYITLWNESWEKVKKDIKKDSILALSGTLLFDTYKNQNTIHTTRTTRIEILN